MPKTIYSDNSPLTKDKRFTFLTGDVNAGATSLGVVSTLNFASLTTSSGQIIFIGELGQERSEIIKTSPNAGPGGTAVTLVSGLRFDHPQDTKVYLIDWDRFEVQTAATVGGSKTTLMTYPQYLQPSLPESIFRDSSVTSGFFFVRFNETVGNTNSDWSDAIPYGGFADNTVFAIKQRALDSLNQIVDPKLVNQEFINRALWEARREYHNSPGKRPFRRKYNTDIGNVVTGMYRINLPSDCEKPYGSENVYGVRIGTSQNLEYYDKKNWDWDFVKKPHTTLTTAYALVDQDLYVANARDFDGSGVVYVNGGAIAYSERSATTMRISTAGPYASNGSTDDVWQNVSHGLPDKFTVWADVSGSAYIYFNRPLDIAYVDQNIFLDYYRTVVDVDSEADQLDEPQYDMYVPYLAFKIRQRMGSGQVKIVEDPQYQEWLIKKQNALQAEYLSTEIRIRPSIEHLLEHY